MTPKEKASELYFKYHNLCINGNSIIAKQCVLIVIDEILHDCIINRIWYGETVKLEIKLL